MKKIILFSFLILTLTSCHEEYNIIGLKKGDKRTIETEHYIYIERCTGRAGIGASTWKYEKIISKDSISYDSK